MVVSQHYIFKGLKKMKKESNKIFGRVDRDYLESDRDENWEDEKDLEGGIDCSLTKEDLDPRDEN